MTKEPQRRTALITLGVLLAIALYLIWEMTARYLSGIFLGIVLGISGLPIYYRLERWRRPGLAAAVATLAIMLLVMGPVLFMAVTVASEAQGMYQSMAQSSHSHGGWAAWFGAAVSGHVARIAEFTGMSAAQIQDAVTTRLQDGASMAMSGIGKLFGNVTSTLLDTAIGFLTLFFFFRNARSLRAKVLRWIPLPQHRAAELVDVAVEAIRVNVYGTLTVAVAQGALLGAGFAIVGLPSPWLWGVIGVVCSMVPVVGTALIWVPGAVALLVGGAWVRAIILALWCLLMVVGVSDNILRPFILRGRMPMNTLLIVLSILGGVESFGLVGVIAGPVVFSLAAALLKILREMFLEPDEDAPEPCRQETA